MISHRLPWELVRHLLSLYLSLEFCTFISTDLGDTAALHSLKHRQQSSITIADERSTPTCDSPQSSDSLQNGDSGSTTTEPSTPRISTAKAPNGCYTSTLPSPVAMCIQSLLSTVDANMEEVSARRRALVALSNSFEWATRSSQEIIEIRYARVQLHLLSLAQSVFPPVSWEFCG